MDGVDVDEAATYDSDEAFGGTGGADADGGAAKALEVEPALADEGASVAAGLGVEAPEYLHQELVGEPRVDPILASHYALDETASFRVLYNNN